MNSAPAFQHYANDFLAETAFLSMEGRGVFITLKSYYWVKNGLPNDMRLLARLCALSEEAFTEIWDQEIKDLFIVVGDKILSADLDHQRIFQEEKREKAKASADVRWGNANAMRTQCTPTSTPTSEKNSVKERPLRAETAAAKKSALNGTEEKTPVVRRIWKDGIELLTNSGINEKSARSLLGKLAKDYGNERLAECIAVTQAKNPVNAEAFLIGALKERKNGSSKNGKTPNELEAERRWLEKINEEAAAELAEMDANYEKRY